MPTASQPPLPKRLSVEPPAQLVIRPGATATQTLRVYVQPGFYVNSDRPKDEFLIPLKLTWTAGGALEAVAVHYPPPEDVQVDAQKLSVLTGRFEIRTEFRASPHAPKGPALLNGRLSYQACNNQMCFRPASADVRLPVAID